MACSGGIPVQRYLLSEVFVENLNRLGKIEAHHSIVEVLNASAADVANIKYKTLNSVDHSRLRAPFRRTAFNFGVAITQSLESTNYYTPDPLRDHLLSFSTAARAELKLAVAQKINRGLKLSTYHSRRKKSVVATPRSKRQHKMDISYLHAGIFNADSQLNSIWSKWVLDACPPGTIVLSNSSTRVDISYHKEGYVSCSDTTKDSEQYFGL